MWYRYIAFVYIKQSVPWICPLVNWYLMSKCEDNHTLFFTEISWSAVRMPSILLPPPRRICNRHCASVYLFATLRKNFETDLHEIFRECWQWVNEQMIKFWWRSVSPSGYRDCLLDSSLLGDMESASSRSFVLIRHMPAVVIIKLEDTERFARLRDWYHDTGKTWLGGGMHSASVSS